MTEQGRWFEECQAPQECQAEGACLNRESPCGPARPDQDGPPRGRCAHPKQCRRGAVCTCDIAPGQHVVLRDGGSRKGKPPQRPLRQKLQRRIEAATLELGPGATLEQVAERSGCSVALIRRYLRECEKDDG